MIERHAQMSDQDWLEIKLGASGYNTGTSDDFPALAAAICKLRGCPLEYRMSAAWLLGFCRGVMEMKQ